MRLKDLVWYLSWEWVGEVSLLPSPRVIQRNWRIGDWDCVTECVCERGEMESQAGLGSSGAQRVRESWRMNRVRYFRVLLFRPNGAFCTFFFLIGWFSANTVFFSWFSVYREWKKKGHGTDAQAAASDSGSAAILPRWCIIDQHYLVAVDALMGISNFQLLCIFLNIPKDMGINMTFLLKALQGPFIVQIFLK